MNNTPIAVFGYTRLPELQRTLHALSQCRGFSNYPVHLFLDGAKGSDDAGRVAAVRAFARGLGWPNLTLHESGSNRGLKRSIIAGVTSLVEAHGAAIVIEDDLLLSPSALDYFSAGLAAYADEDRVRAICGYMYRLPRRAPSDRAFFLPFASSWGWATWSRAWLPFVASEPELLAGARDAAFLRRFDRQGIIAASTMLKGQNKGLIDSWAILWNAHVCRTDGLVLFPKETMVLNGGFASAGATHASGWNPINRLLVQMNRNRRFGQSFSLPQRVEPDEAMRREVSHSWEPRLHRLSSRLGYWRRLANRKAPRKVAAVT